ncbi:hypothetical protein COT98_01290 [Candidatus Falkowbacteria bacterium CG10_big_fil_rev_8_21_14_0_10_39_9]|uniref:N-acetyltransferase domain-containing protein n=1 Tax=Candidatus Falkowbacteria bacterium CG10_big_fil_rev_8_21_14_0_10_39_9 TaxID=1974566 RepID=A0A2M6WQN9_9BACT|nr:MAG: hypothetical protein COT98_01290 [Candidatus Falkowbacteria bacterium CG10_big_fil_rev_8_21_14_0_10_39_9]
MVFIKKKNGISFRLATETDVEKMAIFEKDVWGETGADEEKISSRIKTFPGGNIIALYQGDVVGYISFEYVDNVAKMSNFSWSEITDNGKISQSHSPQGKYIYGVTISVHRSMNGKNLSTLLMLHAWGHLILNNKTGVFLGSRIPDFKNYKKWHPNIDVNDYIKLRRNGKLRGYELRMYGEEGLLPVKVLSDYFPDEASLNYGVLLYLENPFYRWPFRRILTWLFMKAPLFRKFLDWLFVSIVPYFTRNKNTTKTRKGMIKSISESYSVIKNKYSFWEKKTIQSWLLMLPGSGCEHHKKTGGCTMCGFHQATDKYTHIRLFFKAMFLLAQRVVRNVRPQEIFVFNGGSFFNDKEIPVNFQKYLYRHVASNNYLQRLVVESRCEYITADKISLATKILGNKKLMVGIGLESQDDHIRNKIVCKSLTKARFEEKVNLLKEYGADVLAYVFLKPIGLTDEEAFEEAIKTIKYALSVGVKEIALSCAFVQEGTKMSQAYHEGRFTPPSLWTVLKVIAEIRANNWPVHIGGFSDEPKPIAIPCNCPDCSPQIYEAIEQLREKGILGSIPTCNCLTTNKSLI